MFPENEKRSQLRGKTHASIFIHVESFRFKLFQNFFPPRIHRGDIKRCSNVADRKMKPRHCDGRHDPSWDDRPCS